MPDGMMSQGRMLLTTDAVGGVWRYTLDLAHGLSDRGVASIVAVLGPPPDAVQTAEARAIRGVELVRTGQPLDWTATDSDALAHAADRLGNLATLMGVKRIHLHSPALVGSAPWPAPVVAVAHSCVGTWWHAMRDGPPPDDFTWRIEALAVGLRRAAAVIAPSAAHAAALQAVYGALPVTVVHNGATPMLLPPGVRHKAVLTAGRLWDEAKGAAVLDRAAAGLDAPVQAAGSIAGPNGARVVLAHMTALGSLDQAGMAAAYAGASVFASMARYEPFGLAVLEAAHAGMRLVLSDIPSFRELWDGVATFVSDPTALQATLREALEAAGDGGAAERAGRYTVDRMVDGTLAVHRAARLVQA